MNINYELLILGIVCGSLVGWLAALIKHKLIIRKNKLILEEMKKERMIEFEKYFGKGKE